MDYIHQLNFFIQDTVIFIGTQMQNRNIMEWMFFFMPFYIFGEFPRYIFPSIGLVIYHFIYPVDREEQKRDWFLASNPKISVLLVGYNEEKAITNAIESLIEIKTDNIEIIVIDDHSEDLMYEKAKPFADKGLIKLFKNTGATGRAGRPTVSNMAFSYSTGDYILSVDADTSFDRDIIKYMIGPFYNPKIGGVAGNLKPRNSMNTFWTKCQTIEYAMSIGIWKRWLNLFSMNMQASGAFGAFRREALLSVGAWDPELAEDADISLKIKRAGWQIEFAPKAIAMTNTPETRKELTSQRIRWDKGMLRTYFRKHIGLLDIRIFDWKNAFELSMEFFFSVFLTFLYAIYLAVMIFAHPKILMFVWFITYFVYVLTAFLVFGVSLSLSERKKEESELLPVIFLFPLYKSYFRWVRFYALLLETLRVNYDENYLPSSARRSAKKW